MSKPSTEPTTRDVLQRVTHRLRPIEGDQRSLYPNVDDQFAAQEARADTRCRWTIGLILMACMSTVGTILLLR